LAVAVNTTNRQKSRNNHTAKVTHVASLSMSGDQKQKPGEKEILIGRTDV
jgi:hypothetical protein